MSERKIVVVSAGLGTPSSSRMLADELAAATARAVQEWGGDVQVQVIELREFAVDIAHNMVTGYAPPKLAAAIDAVLSADGLITVTPVFTGSFSGLYKSFFDVLDHKALAGKPVLIAATGGTARHSMVLDHAIRPMFSYLRARVVPTAVFAAPEDWGSGEAGVSGLDRRIVQAAGELALMVTDDDVARRVAEPGVGAAAAVPENQSFEQLLGELTGQC